MDSFIKFQTETNKLSTAPKVGDLLIMHFQSLINRGLHILSNIKSC